VAARIAIIGGGAIGGVLAAAAHHSGHEPTLCVRTPFDRLLVENPSATEEIPARIIADPVEVGAVDWVLLTTKVQDVASTAPWFRGLSDSAPVVVVQNGVGHLDAVAPLGLRAPLLPALTYVGAERVSPGHVVRRSEVLLTVPSGSLADEFAALFTAEDTTLRRSEDFTTDAWRKLLTNVGTNPITALTLRRLDVFEQPDISALAEGVIREAVAVGQAVGARLTEADVETVMASLSGGWPHTNGTSMLYDRLAGLPTEHEHISGPVVEAGERNGIPTPLNAALLALMRAVR
jgi:2-dehydropantoate 2-reductase